MTDLNDQEREALANFCYGRYGDTAPEINAFKEGWRAALVAREEPQYGYRLRPWETYGSASRSGNGLFSIAPCSYNPVGRCRAGH